MVSISKFLSSQNILIGFVIVILIGGIFVYYNQKTSFSDGMASYGQGGQGAPLGFQSPPGNAGSMIPQTGSGHQVGMTVDGEPSLRNTAAQNMVQPKNVAQPGDLLPQDGGSSWAKLNPNANINQVVIPDLLEAGYHIGLDTIGQTMKNPNLQERSEPIIPKQAVSPWNNSSFEPDIARVPLEIGYGCN
jgi:hypothetical protein